MMHKPVHWDFDGFSAGVNGWLSDINWDYVGSQIPFWSDYATMNDEYRYWADYKRRTGISPRYPYLHYQNRTMNMAYSALGMASHAGFKIFSPKSVYG